MQSFIILICIIILLYILLRNIGAYGRWIVTVYVAKVYHWYTLAIFNEPLLLLMPTKYIHSGYTANKEMYEFVNDWYEQSYHRKPSSQLAILLCNFGTALNARSNSRAEQVAC